jgi:RecA-family ATPase
MYQEQGYELFIIDSLKLISSSARSNIEKEENVVKAMRKLKNELPICVIMIHHNNKGGKTWS